jgi:hypothetical protein
MFLKLICYLYFFQCSNIFLKRDQNIRLGALTIFFCTRAHSVASYIILGECSFYYTQM